MHRLLTLILLAASQVISIPAGLSTHHFDPIVSLYHSQLNSGQYIYGYATPTSTLRETKSPDGVTRGGYSYIDSNGQLQNVHYTADALHGFQVAATNLPQDLPEVAYAKAKHIADYESIRSERAKLASVAYSNPVAVPITAVTHQQIPQPVTDLPEVIRARNAHLAILNAAYANVAVQQQPVVDLPEVAKARAEHLATFEKIRVRDEALKAQINLSPIPEQIYNNVVSVKTSYHGQELPIANKARVEYIPGILGEYSYGYVGPLSAHAEQRTGDGVTRGGYSYIDANGVVQTVNYIADNVHGFRVAASNIPVDVNHLHRH